MNQSARARLCQNASHACRVSDTMTAQQFMLLRLAGPELEIPTADRSIWLLGRGLDCDLVLPHASVSRHHARLDLSAGRIEDLDSSVGTQVNAVSIKQHTLRAGDRVQLGPWHFAIAPVEDRAVGATLQRAVLTEALAAPRLELLLAFSETINRAASETEIHQALVEAALAGSGCRRAASVDLTRPDHPVLAQTMVDDETFQVSRQLVDATRRGGVIQLGQLDTGERSHSIQACHLVSATAVALMSSDKPVACLYLDARGDELVEMPETARFCQALARMAELALARLHHQQEMWRQREQIYADLHDDLGARLLNQIYRAADTASADEARAMLADLRDVVSRPKHGEMALNELIARLRAETARRLDLAKVEMKWTLEPLPDHICWSNRAAALLSRCLRELISNALRHADPTGIHIAIETRNAGLSCRVRHDGHFQDPAKWQYGRGTRSLIDRSRALGGQISWCKHQTELEACLVVDLEPAP